MGGLVHYSHKLFPLCSRFPPMSTQADIPPDLTDPNKPAVFHKLDAELNSRILMHYCMVSNIILCLHMQVLINEGHRHIHRYPCCHLMEYL